MKLSANNFESVYGDSIIGWRYTKGMFGTTSCKVEYGSLPEDYMRPVVNRVLREGAISPKEIAANKRPKNKGRQRLSVKKSCALLAPGIGI